MRRRRSGSLLVIGLLLIGLCLSVYAAFVRDEPTRRIRMNLWNPPDMEELYEREEARRQHYERQRQSATSPHDAQGETPAPRNTHAH